MKELITQDEQSLLKSCESLVIHNEADALKASSLSSALNQAIKRITAVRIEFTKPLDQKKQEIMANFKTILKPFEDSITLCDQALKDYYKAQKELVEIEKARLLEQHKSDKSPIPEAVIPYVPEAQKTINGITFVKQRIVKMVDIDLIPVSLNGVRLLEPNLTQIRKLMLQDNIQVPGCEIEETEIIRHG